MKHLHFLNTVGKKYTTGYVIMGFFVLLFLAISAFESFYVSDNYSRATSELVNVNSLESSVNSLNETVNMAYLYLSSDGIDAYDDAKGIVERDLGVIKLQLEEEYIRELADTENTVETYLEQSDLLIENLQKYLDSDRKDTAVYVALESNYANLQSTYNYVNHMFQESYTAKLADFSELQVELKKLHSRMAVFQAVMILAMTLICAVYLYKVIREVSTSIRKMKKGVESIKGNVFLAEPIKVESNDEFDEFAEAFNGMIKLIQAQMNKIKENADVKERLAELEIENLRIYSELQKSHLNFLQSGINPHFLFNTLNAGAQLAMMEDAGRTGEFLENVAGFFRYNVRKHDQDASLEEEIHLVDNYVYILNVRFAGEIHFTKDVDESLLDVRVPSMILQPLVENAVNYGIRGLDREGRIELSVYQKDGRICICIWDNGAGMDQERICQVLAGEAGGEDLSSDSNGVGIRNVMERLKLYFHGDAEFSIWSEGKDKGTEVQILIPEE